MLYTICQKYSLPFLTVYAWVGIWSGLFLVVLALTDAHITADGILCKRTKGSRTNVARLGPLQSAAVARLQARRKAIVESRGMPVQIRPEQRLLFVGEGGEPLTYDGFTAHGLKHRGITDSADKSAGGHKSEQMRHRYDHSLPVVEPTADPVEHSQF